MVKKVNFAEILDAWDRQSPGAYIKDEENPEEDKIKRRGRLLRKKPDAAIDLHGLTQSDAWDALNTFFNRSRSLGLEKVLIIHGKGNHSSSGLSPGVLGNEGVLKEITRKFIEQCPFAGTSGRGSNSVGGSGATWVLLK